MNVNKIHKSPETLKGITVRDGAEYAEEILSGLSESFTFHNLQHTIEVVSACQQLGDYYKLSEEEFENLLLAAWFHDTGYSRCYSGHEKESAKIAKEFLASKGASNWKINSVSALILTTRAETKPDDLLQRIFHDANVSHTGTKNYFAKGQQLRRELHSLLHKSFNEEDWEILQYNFIIKTDFLTEAAQETLEMQRVSNIEKQLTRLKKVYKKLAKDGFVKKTGRGTETMYRVTYRNHINLSAIADNKANMMMSLNSIILSSIVAIVGSGLALGATGIEYFRFGIPIGILILASLSSLIFAIQSAKPNVTHNLSPKAKLNARKSSILFFGNFTMLPLEQYLSDMELLRDDNNLLYDNMSIDIYNLGLVLSRKYGLIKISYNVFMFGIILAVATLLSLLVYSKYISNSPIF